MIRKRIWNVSPFVLFITIASALVLVHRGYAQIIANSDFHPTPNGLPGEQQYNKTFQIGPNRSIPVVVDVTAKGNGWMKVANLCLRVYKEHDDGEVFDPPLLHVEFVDITGDGFKGLVIVGTLKRTGEKETDPTTTEPIASIYTFDPKTNHFNLRFRCGPSLDFNADSSPDAVPNAR